MQISDEDRKKAAETIGFAVERIRSVLGEGGREALVYNIAEALSAARAEGRRECALTHGVSKEQ